MQIRKKSHYKLTIILSYIQIFRYKLKIDRKAKISKWIRQNQPKNILEIGVHNGESALRMLKEIRKENLAKTKYFGVDLFAEMQTKDTYIREISLWPDSEEVIYKKISSRFPEIEVNLLRGFSYNKLQELQKNSFDLIFIDGGHSIETVRNDWILSKELITSKGVIFFDDYTDEFGLLNSGFGINHVVDKIDKNLWKIQILKSTDKFQKDWGVLRLRVVKVMKR